MLSELDDAQERPYFLWDEPTTAGEFRAALASAGDAEKARLLGKLMREARDTDVWRFTTLAEVRRLEASIRPYLGRRREFWQYLLSRWESLGLG